MFFSSLEDHYLITFCEKKKTTTPSRYFYTHFTSRCYHILRIIAHIMAGRGTICCQVLTTPEKPRLWLDGRSLPWSCWTHTRWSRVSWRLLMFSLDIHRTGKQPCVIYHYVRQADLHFCTQPNHDILCFKKKLCPKLSVWKVAGQGVSIYFRPCHKRQIRQGGNRRAM